MHDELLTAKEAADYIHSTENSLRWMRSKGKGPTFHRPDGWRVMYRKSDLDAYHAAVGPSSRKKRMNAALLQQKKGPTAL